MNVKFNNVYVQSSATSVGPMEAAGPLKNKFDQTYPDLYCGETSFEKAEQQMIKDACDIALRKKELTPKDIALSIGGDLMNQLGSSIYGMRHLDTAFIGMYGACATSSLVIGQGALWVEKLNKPVLCFTSSHNAVAEKQFRYPNEYGVQKKETTTFTVTGAGAIVLGNEKSEIQVRSFTVGSIVDWNFKNVNDMGKAMAPAAYETILSHFEKRNQSAKDYDLIVSGDLSSVGFSFLCDLLIKNDVEIDNKFFDCGMMIYDIHKQEVFAGGSGCACSMCVSIAHVFELIKKQQLKRVLVVATGALLSPILVQQKDSIPCIAHAIEYVGGNI